MHLAQLRIPFCAALCTLALLAPRQAAASWPHDAESYLPVCTAAGIQTSVAIASDGAGGSIIAWEDWRNGTYPVIYAMRVTADGEPIWSEDGVMVCTSAALQYTPSIIADGTGGAIIAWEDGRVASHDIYAQRISAAGVKMWPAAGVAICAASGGQSHPQVVADQSGGAIVVWHDYRNLANFDIYAQRVSVAGAVQWATGGVAVSAAVGHQESFQAVADGYGGAIVAWHDERSGTWDIYAQRISAAGAAQWTSGGLAACTASGPQTGPQLISDMAGGAIVTWTDYRLPADVNIYATRITAGGTLAWPAGGLPMCANATAQSAPVIAADGSDGAIITWTDYRSGTAQIYAQRVFADGDLQWTTDGVAVCPNHLSQDQAVIGSDGEGGAIVAWAESESSVVELHAQRLSSAGAARWSSGGVTVLSVSGMPNTPVMLPDGAGSAVLAWSHNGTNTDIRAHRIERMGYLGAPEPKLVSVLDVPGDQGGKVKLSWNASYLDNESDTNVSSYDILRSVPPNKALAELATGARKVSDVGALSAKDGASYFVTQLGATTYYWEYLAAQTVLHYVSGYSYIAGTLCDSTATANPQTAFMVVARNSTRSMYWLSAPVLGYSVDDLAPTAPVFLASRYAAGETRVRWLPNAEADLAEYRLYRGTSAGFVPSSANLVSAQPDTGCVVDDGSAISWYKLTAVDSHGNESPVATLSPQQISGTPGDDLPTRTMLAGAAPNPFNPATTIAFSLQQGGHVRLSVFDLGGRLVRVLVDEERAAGHHEVPWDGRGGQGRELASGVYVCRMVAGSFQATTRLTLVK